MAKKTQRLILHLVCNQCRSQNYITEKNKMNTPDKLVLRKYCKRCRKVTEHKESTKMK